LLALMDDILADDSKTDEDIYNELKDRMGEVRKTLAPLHQIHALGVLKKGMGSQAAKLTRSCDPKAFHNYLEVFDRRYHDAIKKKTGMPLDGEVISVGNSSDVGITDRLQAGALFSRYPYTTHVSLNDDDCTDPATQVDKTYRPLGNEIADGSLDMVAIVGGLHHAPSIDREKAFMESVRQKMSPGGVVLLREHDYDEYGGLVDSIAEVVHSFVNAESGAPWDVEASELREFSSCIDWGEWMEERGFERLSPDNLILEGDPTQNAMMAFVRTPDNLAEIKVAAKHLKDHARPLDGTRATWIEWGNVRSSKQYAEFIQDHHSFAFDYIGHLRQHYQYVYHYFKESLADGVKLTDMIFSDNFSMNMFILLTATIQLGLSQVVSLPTMLVARIKHGKEWRNLTDLTELEKFDARVEKEYSKFIDHTPFYSFDYIGKIRDMWGVIYSSDESLTIKLSSVLPGVSSTFGYLAKAAISAPIRAFYTSETNFEPETIQMIVSDPYDEIEEIHNNIKVIYIADDGHKLISVPRYRPFTEICGSISEHEHLDIIEIGAQDHISVDVKLGKDDATPKPENARLVYEMPKLQDKDGARFATYHVAVSALSAFQRAVGRENIEYIHE
ncbi:MAG: hypothetical protein P0S94_04310, partial [Simkaniaceae bacterium]|nr:hypothetical protein [Simkaniaceae bacterium]